MDKLRQFAFFLFPIVLILICCIIQTRQSCRYNKERETTMKVIQRYRPANEAHITWHEGNEEKTARIFLYAALDDKSTWACASTEDGKLVALSDSINNQRFYAEDNMALFMLISGCHVFLHEGRQHALILNGAFTIKKKNKTLWLMGHNQHDQIWGVCLFPVANADCSPVSEKTNKLRFDQILNYELV